MQAAFYSGGRVLIPLSHNWPKPPWLWPIMALRFLSAVIGQACGTYSMLGQSSALNAPVNYGTFCVTRIWRERPVLFEFRRTIERPMFESNIRSNRTRSSSLPVSIEIQRLCVEHSLFLSPTYEGTILGSDVMGAHGLILDLCNWVLW